MPVAIGITRQMEEMAAENKLHDVADQMLSLKTIIAKFVQSMYPANPG